MTHQNVFKPQTRNGWRDDGKAITSGERCPNCGSTAYRQTVSTESCSDCGLRFNYWSSGGNQVYQAYLDRKHAAEERAEQARRDAEDNAHGYDGFADNSDDPCAHW